MIKQQLNFLHYAQVEQAQQQTAQQNLQASGADQAAQAQSQEPLGAAADLENQEFFVPLKQIGSVQKNALAEATAMAKRKGDNFELVVNIQRFTPEEVKVYIAGQSVVVQAKHVDAEGLVTDSYEQKFAVPDDVDCARLSSGISKDGVLMIRVPRRTPDRLIPIQHDAKIEAVEKALSQAMQSEKVTILDG